MTKIGTEHILLFFTLVIFFLTAQSVHTGLSILLSGALVYVLIRFFKKYPHLFSLPHDDGRALALVRILVSALLIHQLIRVKFLSTTKLPEELSFDTFTSLLQSLPFYHAISSSETALTILLVVTLYLLGFALFGYKCKYTIPLAAVFYTFTYSFVLQYYNLWHESIVPLYILAALSMLPAGDRYSLDALAQNVQRRSISMYSHSLFVVFAVLSFTYLSLGASKLLHSGLRWTLPDNVRGHLLGAGYNKDGSLVDAFLITTPDVVFVITGIAVLVLQVGFIATLFFKHARVLFPVGGLIFSLSIMLFMNIYFYDLVLINTLLLCVTLFFWKKELPMFVASFAENKHVLGTLIVAFFIFASQWHGYTENFPFTSWDMYSGKSQFTESVYKHNRTITRYQFVVEYEDGSARYFNATDELRIHAMPGKCLYRYEPRYFDDCLAFYEHAAKELFKREQKKISTFVVSKITLEQPSDGSPFMEREPENERFVISAEMYEE